MIILRKRPQIVQPKDYAALNDESKYLKYISSVRASFTGMPSVLLFSHWTKLLLLPLLQTVSNQFAARVLHHIDATAYCSYIRQFWQHVISARIGKNANASYA